MKRSTFVALLMLGAPLLSPSSVRSQAPERQTLAPTTLPGGGDIQELAQIKLLKDLTPRLQRYTAEERHSVYLAIAVQRELLTAAEATDMLASMGNIAGFDRAARQLCGYGSPARDGALFELRIARAFLKGGARLIEIRQPFKDDPAKRRTDIDLVIEYPLGQRVGIECKSGAAPTDSVNADAVTLQHFIAHNPGARAAFAFSAAPSALSRKLLASKGIGIFVGDPSEQAKALAEFMADSNPAKAVP